METPNERDLEGLSGSDQHLLETMIKDDGISKIESEEDEEEEEGVLMPSSRWLCGILHVAEGWWKCLIISAVFILPPMALFVNFIARESKVVWIPLAVLVGFVHIFMFLTVFTEPGVIPRFTGGCPKENEAATITWGNTYLLHYDKLCTVGEMGPELVRRWCSTCKVLRPPRASHCSYCNNCVDMFDHHCGLLGACIGGRNFRFFAGFLWTSTAMALWVASWSAYYHFYKDSFMDHLVDPGVDLPDGANIVSICLLVYCGLVLWSVGWFGLLYVKYTIFAHTQREWEKRGYLFGSSPSPFDTCCFYNCFAMLCKPPASLLSSRVQSPVKKDPWATSYPLIESNV